MVKRIKHTIILFLVIATVVFSCVCNIVNTATGRISGAADAVGGFAQEKAASWGGDILATADMPTDAEQFAEILEGITTSNITAFLLELKGNVNLEAIFDTLKDLKSEQRALVSAENSSYVKITEQISDVKTFVSEPSKILGSDTTKFGEIAEHLDVMARNEEQLSKGLAADATFEGVGRTAPEDYIVAGKAVQSKFYNGVLNTLNAVVEHQNTYKYFGADGKSYYVIPKDQYEMIQKGRGGEQYIEGRDGWLHSSTITAIKNKISMIEQNTGSSFNEAVKPSKFTYSEVQLGCVDSTIEAYETQTKIKHDSRKAEIAQNAKTAQSTAVNAAIKTDFIKIGKAAGFAASLETFIVVGFEIYEKVSKGKNIENFSEEDWKEIGIAALDAATEGAVLGAATEILMVFGMPVHFAAAAIATVFRILELNIKYQAGAIDFDEFIGSSIEACADSSMIMVGAFIGQMLIPIPIAGSIVGSLVTSIVLSAVKTNTIASDQLFEQASIYMQNFKERYDVLIKEAGDTFAAGKDTSKFALTSLYDSAKTAVRDAVEYTQEKGNELYAHVAK